MSISGDKENGLSAFPSYAKTEHKKVKRGLPSPAHFARERVAFA
jgi:hypothetical protein